jgi:putative transposase
MSQSMSKVLCHMVYSTKNRQRWLLDPQLCKELYAYMATILRDNVDSPALLIGGTEDHIHALLLLSRKFAIMDVVKESKTETTKWLKRQAACNPNFAWQAGYGMFSVSESNRSPVSLYIENQEEHHRELDFKDEFRELCRRHGLELDERYAWD